MKLSSIVQELKEGVKVSFDEKGEPTAIDIAYQHIDGEQLNTDDSFNKREGYKVFYSLSSDPKATNIKASEDALKYNSDKIKPEELRGLLKSTIVTQIPKVDYIGFLESKGKLNKLLVSTLSDLYGGAEVVSIAKIEYTDIRKAVDWEDLERQTDIVKKAVNDFLEKISKEAPPYKIRKSDKVQSMVIRKLHSKYNIGLHPSGEGEKFPPVYNAIVECLTKGKSMLIVDDNTHTGTDFVKLFQGIERIKEGLVDANSKPTEKEEEALRDIQRAKSHPRFKTSKHLQDLVAKHQQELELYRARVSILNHNINRSRDHFFGYALYLLQDSDLKR